MGEHSGLTLAMRSTTSITSTPSGECGARIVIELGEETNLYDILCGAWDAWMAQQAEASPQPSEARGRTDASLTPGTNQSNLKEERS